MKPRLYTPVGFTEFNTEDELFAFVQTNSPGDPVILLATSEMNKEKFLCRDLLDDLRLEFKKQIQAATMTVAEATDVYNRVATTFSALNSGWLRESRMLANNTATGGSFTAPRKTFLLNSIDAAIAKL